MINQNNKHELRQLLQQKQYQQALDLVNELMQLQPTNLFLVKNEIYLLSKLEQKKAAKQKSEEFFDALKEDPFFLLTYLLILEKEKQFDDIKDIIAKYIFAPGVIDEFLLQNVCRLAQRRFTQQESNDIIAQAQALLPGSQKIVESTGHQNHYQQYKKQFVGKTPSQVLAEIGNLMIMPEYENDTDLLLLKAENHKQINQFDHAIESYKKVLTIDPEHDFAVRMLGYTLYKKKAWREALPYLANALQHHCHDHYLQTTIGYCCKNLDDFDALVKIVNESLAIHPEAKHLYGMLQKAKKWQKSPSDLTN